MGNHADSSNGTLQTCCKAAENDYPCIDCRDTARVDCRDTARIDCRDTAEATQEVCRSTSADQQQRVSDTIHGVRPKSAYLLPDIVHQTAARGVLHDKVEDVVGEVHVQQADDAGMLQA